MKRGEVAQLYITHPESGVGIPLYSLKGFKRITLAPGASEKVNFKITPTMMELVNEDGKSGLNSGKITIGIAGSLPSQRGEELGSAKPAEAMLTEN
jgi:beta-glucosidase